MFYKLRATGGLLLYLFRSYITSKWGWQKMSGEKALKKDSSSHPPRWTTMRNMTCLCWNVPKMEKKVSLSLVCGISKKTDLNSWFCSLFSVFVTFIVIFRCVLASLYEDLSVRPSVGPSVGPSVRWSVGRSRFRKKDKKSLVSTM